MAGAFLHFAFCILNYCAVHFRSRPRSLPRPPHVPRPGAIPVAGDRRARIELSPAIGAARECGARRRPSLRVQHRYRRGRQIQNRPAARRRTVSHSRERRRTPVDSRIHCRAWRCASAILSRSWCETTVSAFLSDSLRSARSVPVPAAARVPTPSPGSTSGSPRTSRICSGHRDTHSPSARQ